MKYDEEVYEHLARVSLPKEALKLAFELEVELGSNDYSDMIRKLVAEIDRLEDIRNHYVERIAEVSKPTSSELQDEMDKITGKWVAK